jgi:hypothetical protein
MKTEKRARLTAGAATQGDRAPHAPAPPHRELHTLESLREVYCIPHSTVYEWFKLGLLPKVKIGARTYVKDDDVRSLIDRNRTAGKAA